MHIYIFKYIFRKHDRKFNDKYVNFRGKLTVSDVKGVLQSIMNFLSLMEYESNSSVRKPHKLIFRNSS